MSQDFLIKVIATLVMSAIFVWGIFSRYHEESGGKNGAGDQQKYLPLIVGNLLPVCILAVAIFGLFTDGLQETIKLIISVCFGVFLHTSIYYIVLIAAIPLFRRYISARTCAALWMIPNYLYIAFYDFMNMNEPIFVIHTPKNIVWPLFGIWLTGFFMVLSGNIASHVIFRRNLLKVAKEITDVTILEIWNEELENAKMQYKKYPVMISSGVKTPLSVGLFRRKICVVLPDKEYTAEELRFVFRHEIVHIGREDAWSKFFLLFCTAMCWFNPLMWIAMRKSAEDLELSCDETVLLNEDAKTRHQYANLILNTAGSERGFTTCLSASASAMRYRLKNIMKTKMRRSGAVVVGTAFFVLFMSYGYVALAYGGGTGREVVYESKDPGLFSIDDLYFSAKDSDFNTRYECVNEDALYEYFADLTMMNLTGNYSFSDRDKELSITYGTSKGRMYVSLSDHMIKVTPAYNKEWKDWETQWYYVEEEIDWAYLEKIIVSYPALNVQFIGENGIDQKDIPAAIITIKKLESGISTIMFEREIPEDAAPGLYNNRSYDRMILKFSDELVSACTVEIVSWEGIVQETIITDMEGRELEIPMAQYPAHYRVNAVLLGMDQEIYEVDFLFNVAY